MILLVAAFLIHGHVLERFWLDDDPQVLLHATRYGPLEVATDRVAWQELSTSNFTPLVTWSFDLDLSLFGLDPLGFYIHQLIAIAFAAVALRLMLILRGVNARASTLTALLFLVMPPTFHIAGHLMTRHYIEGLILSLLAIIFWSRANSDASNSGWLTAGVIAYLGAIMAKEVYLLVPVVLLALDLGSLRIRSLLVRLLPYAGVLAGYLLWRSWILGGGGGYGDEHPILHLVNVGTSWIERDPWSAAWLGLVGVVSAVAWSRTRRGAYGFVLITAACTAPLAGVGDALEPRHLLVPAVAALSGAVAGARMIERASLRAVTTWLVVVVSIVVAIGAWSGSTSEAMRMEAEGRYVWEEGEGAVPLVAHSPGWYLEGIADLDLIWRGESSPKVFYSELGLLMLERRSRYLMFDQHGTPQMQYLGDMPRLESYEPSAPIELEIARKGHALRWDFGPECDCTWTFYSYPGYGMFHVPESGRRIVPRPRDRQWFRIGRHERDGSWTMSPPLALPSEGEMIRWRRAENDAKRNQSN